MKHESGFHLEVLGGQGDQRVREHEMSDEEIRNVADEFGLEVEKARELLVEGLNLLASSTVSSPYAESIADKLSTDAVQKPFSLSTGKRGVKEFRLFFHKQRFLEMTGVSSDQGREYFDATFKRRDIDSDVPINQWVDSSTLQNDPSVIGINIDNSNVPLTTNKFHYGIYSAENDELHAILPFESSITDIDATDRVDAGCCDEGVYFRKLPTGEQEREEALNALTFDTARVAEIIASVDETLGMRLDKRSLSLIISTEGFEAAAIRRTDRSGGIHRILMFSRNDIEGVSDDRPLENSASRIRHEYLHLVDNMLSTNGRYFSEEIGQDLVDLVAMHLFPGQSIALEKDGQTVAWPDHNRVHEALSERRFLADGKGDNSGLPGHPGDNIRELFVSIVNSYLDPRFESALKGAEMNGINIASLHREVARMVHERIDKINKTE